NTDQRRQMIDLGTSHRRLSDAPRIAYVAVENFEPRRQIAREIFQPTCFAVGRVADHGAHATAASQQGLDEMAADESARTGYQDERIVRHGSRSSPLCLARRNEHNV